MKKNVKSIFGKFQKKYLVCCVSAVMTTMVSFPLSVQASDIDIYQKPTAGNITLMLMLDISGSMGSGRESVINATNPKGYGYSYIDDYGLDCGTSSQTTLPTNGNGLSSFVNNTAYYVTSKTSPSYSRNFCYVNTANASIRPLVQSNCESVTGGFRCYDRLTKLKDGLFDLLLGNTTNGVEKLSDDKVIGLSAFSYSTVNMDTSLITRSKGFIVVPARSLGTMFNGLSQREILLNNIANLKAYNGTPTANAYAETAAYLMGTTTYNVSEPDTRYYFQNTSEKYDCITWSGTSCTSWSGSWPVNDLDYYNGYKQVSGRLSLSALAGIFYDQGDINRYSGFLYSAPESKSEAQYIQPTSLVQTTADQQCSGQGIYVLTDGAPNASNDRIAQSLMNRALNGTSNLVCNNTVLTDVGDGTGAWQCIGNFAQTLLDSTKNPAKLKFKTAVVGFGTGFNGIPSYSASLTQAHNVSNINSSSASQDQKNAALWGVYGQGGWYSGSNSSDVVNSVNSFLGQLSVEIPSVTTGTATIPVDKLNPYVLQNYAYYPQFQPTPDKDYQLWAGNLKKYSVSSIGKLLDLNGLAITDSNGQILDNYDLWSTNTDQGTAASRLVGGVKAQLKLRSLDGGNTVQRKILTNRDFSQSNHQSSSNTLNQITLDYLTNNSTKDDPDRGYLMSLLGYAVDATQPSNITKATLQQASELRQVGAVMHSSPLLVTNSGIVTYDENGVGSKDRQDYVLFGTTQGLLHVVDANTGQEKFAFLPNEMVENQKQAFLSNDSTSGGTNSLYYGVDGPWTSYTKYVLADNDVNTVGKGLYDKTGSQIVYGGLRMGGKSYYALDLVDINNPKLLFQINPQGTCSSSNPLGCMGQSWSKPSIGWVNWKGTRKLVMFVGGGYDAEGDGPDVDKNNNKYKGYEFDDYQQTSKKGAGVYMFDALTGDLLWWASVNATSGTTGNVVGTYDENLKYSVVSEIKTVDRTTDGLIDHLYFGDLGGQVWRIDLNNVTDSPALFAKAPVRLLNLHQDASSPRFYEMPSFSTYVNNGQIMAVLSIGSGNRSSPLAEYDSSATNYNNDAIYNIYDKDVVRSDLFELNNNTYKVTKNDLYTQDITLLKTQSNVAPTTLINQLFPITDSIRFTQDTIYASYANTQGWYYLYKGDKTQSQKVLTTPIVINNDLYSTIFDSSKLGTQGSCGAGVKGRSSMSLFCMPFGQCKTGSVESYTLDLGSGIVSGGIGNSGDGSRLVVANVDTSGITGNEILTKRYSPVPKLTPQRWYEKYQ